MPAPLARLKPRAFERIYDLTEDEYQLILDDLALSDPVRVSALNAYRETARGLQNEEGRPQIEA